MTNPCFILGNGPSLRDFDFQGLGDTASLGMNAAYRYWDEINWYPTYFACLDDQLIISHHDEIYRLWKDGNIKAFFVHGTFFDHHPDCICAPEFTSLDQVLPHWFRERGRAQGWPSLMDHPAFWTEDTTKVTTGAWATRFAAYMGHDLLALAGIDLQYVEILPEAKQGEGVKLEMAETPDSNPNYFFDSYQRKGDKFNVPNPAAHDGRLHIDSFRLVRRDFAVANPRVTVVNTNPASQLEIDRVFPLRSVADVVAAPVLSAVVVPATGFEIAAILANFDIWNAPAYAPLSDGAAGLTALHFVFNNRGAEPYEALIRDTFAATGMDRYFSALRFTYLGLTGTADAYTRDYSQQVGNEGYKSGPNNQFFGMVEAMAGADAPVFQMETDCVPLRPGWLEALRAAVEKADPFWILGARYTGMEKLDPAFANHLNGNAIYAVNDPAFQDFVRSFWQPRTRAMVAGEDKRLAYDCILEVIFTRHADDPEVATLLADHGDKFRPHAVILNISGKGDLEHLVADYETALLEPHPDAFILHNRTAQERVAARLAQVRPIPEPGQIDGPRVAAPRADVIPPRLLVIDMTVMGGGSATGEVKANLLRGFPDSHVLQLAAPKPDTLALVKPDGAGGFAHADVDADGARAAIADFAPDLILYRILPDRPALHALAMALIDELKLPLAVWLMDDWPARLFASDRTAFAAIDTDLRRLLKQARLRLSISDAMSLAFQARYGVPFTAFANGIDPAAWANPRIHTPGPVVLRYAGGLAPDMNAASVQMVARAVQALAAEGHDIRLEINTQSWWLEGAKRLFAGMKAVSITAEKRDFTAYRDWLSGADILLVAYNFDPASTRYVRYSMANKMPECLASGAAVLAVGPGVVATVEYLAHYQLARVVTEDTPGAVKSALAGLMQPGARQTLAARARKRVVAHHDLGALSDDLLARLDDARKTPAQPDLRLYLVEGAQGTGVKFSDTEELAAATAALASGGRGVMIYDDPVTALATGLTPRADPHRVMASWQDRAEARLALYRAHRDRITLLMRTPLGAFSDQELRDLTRATGLARPPEPLDTPLVMPDPVTLLMAQHLIDNAPAAASLASEMAASRQPWGGATTLPRPDPAVALAHWHHQHQSTLDAQLVRAQARIEMQAEDIARITGSASWRITGKLRGLRARLGRIKRRVWH